jgi:hypothetical protein
MTKSKKHGMQYELLPKPRYKVSRKHTSTRTTPAKKKTTARHHR